MDPRQGLLFDAPVRIKSGGRWPDGLLYRNDFITPAQEAALLAEIDRLPLAPARYKAYTARRLVLSYGGEYDYDRQRLLPGAPLPAMLEPLRERVAHWLHIAPAALAQALVARYPPGTALGWHRDVPDFEVVVGISLGSPARMRLRPYAHVNLRRGDVLDLELAPRSVYVLQQAARWDWQHSIAPTPGLRHSITFRTRRSRRLPGAPRHD